MQQQMMQLYWMQNGYLQFYQHQASGQSAPIPMIPVKQEEK